MDNGAAGRFDIALRGRRVITATGERACVIGVRDGKIARISDYDSGIDADVVIEIPDDHTLLPGLVDSHVHVNEPGRTDWEGFASATRAAAAGGVTTVVDMPLNSIPPTTTVSALRIKQAAARDQAHVDVGFWGGAVPENLGELAALHEAGVFGFKCFLLDSGVPEFRPLDAGAFPEAMAEAARLDAVLIVHAEDADVIDRAGPAAGRSYRAFLRSRPDAAESRAIQRVVDVARATGARAHIVHLSSATALDTIREARRSGVRLSVETCPHYLCLAAEAVPDGATQFKCCPPIRDKPNQDLLWQALASGEIDAIVSDHSPCTVDLKRLDSGDFGQAWGGIASVQLGLPAVWTEARRRGHSLAEVCAWMSTGPADLLGLRRKGRIAVGADADLCLFDPGTEFVVDPADLLHRNPVSAYAGQRLSGVVRRTWLRGVPTDPRAAPAVARGRLLTRGER